MARSSHNNALVAEVPDCAGWSLPSLRNCKQFAIKQYKTPLLFSLTKEANNGLTTKLDT